jgi:hypothetical protein
MTAKTFISLMLLLLLFTTGLLVSASTTSNAVKEEQKKECPAGTECADDTQVQAADGMIWESVSRHLLSAVQ